MVDGGDGGSVGRKSKKEGSAFGEKDREGTHPTRVGGGLRN